MTAPQRNARMWLTRYVDLQQKADKRIIAALRRADRDAAKRIAALRGRTSTSAIAERAQLQQSRAAIKRVLAELWVNVESVTKAAQQEAAELATDNSWIWDEFLLTRAGLSAADMAAMRLSWEQTAYRNVEAAIARMTRTQRPLSRRVYRSKQLTDGSVDRIIDSALVRGISWAQFAREVRTSIRPDTPGGVAYAAKRLARTEINNAYHAISIEQNRDKPWNTGMGWRTSGSHPEPDICDLYADRSPYPVGEVPEKPHPQCLCYTYPETVSPEEFLRELSNGSYDNYMNRKYRNGTTRAA